MENRTLNSNSRTDDGKAGIVRFQPHRIAESYHVGADMKARFAERAFIREVRPGGFVNIEVEGDADGVEHVAHGVVSYLGS